MRFGIPFEFIGGLVTLLAVLFIIGALYLYIQKHQKNSNSANNTLRPQITTVGTPNKAGGRNN